MSATLSRPRTRRIPASAVRELLLEATYRLHATRVIKRVREDRPSRRNCKNVIKFATSV
jgi:hypothetical protein